MRLIDRGLLCLLLVILQLHAQAISDPFLSELTATFPAARESHNLMLQGDASWTAGSLHESGSAILQIASDGSFSVGLKFNKASHTESRDAFAANRKCRWNDASGSPHDLQGPDCATAIAWFDPFALLNLPSRFPDLVTTTDDGVVTRDASKYHEISCTTNISNPNPKLARLLTDATRVNVLFDTLTLLPSSIEYSLHADRNWNQSVKVRVTYNDYRVVSGMPIPYGLNMYVNGTLQLSIHVDSATLK